MNLIPESIKMSLLVLSELMISEGICFSLYDYSGERKYIAPSSMGESLSEI